MNIFRAKIILLIVSFFVISGCSTVPSEFYSSMDAEQKGIDLLAKRHVQAVSELVNVWYIERMETLAAIKQAEINKVTIILPSPDGNGSLTVVEKESLLKIEAKYDAAVKQTYLAKLKLENGYSDKENWMKIKKIHAVNSDMAKSLLDLNQAQRSFYAGVVGENTPYPADFLNEKSNQFLNSFSSLNEFGDIE